MASEPPVNANAYAKWGTSCIIIKPGTIMVTRPIMIAMAACIRVNSPRIKQITMKLSDNTVFITGGASGIGFALAKGFLELKNTVIICGRNSGKLKRVKERFPDIHVIPCDVTNEDDIHKESPDFVANKFFTKFAKDHCEIKPGLMNIMLLQMNRFLPSLAEEIAKKR